MIRTVIPGGWYGDYLPSGGWCVLVPNAQIRTHRGDVAFPPGEAFGPLFLRATDVEGFRFAGQAHDTTNPACWEYDDRWLSYPPPPCGVSPVIYDRDGVLHRSDCGPGVGSQGYRYVNEANEIVSGDATYRIDLGDGRLLFEYTDVGGLLIGQAAYDGGGVQVWDGAVLRQLELGDCRFIRANRAGELVTMAFTRPEGVVLLAATMAELRALSPVVPPAPEPGPKPPDPGPEPPEPGPEPPEPPDPGPTPIPPTGGPMEPFAVAYQIGVHFARVDRNGVAPWPGWFPVRFDRTDPSDPDCRFVASQPEPGNPRLKVTAAGSGFLTADFTEFGGSVCDGFYCSPEALGWGGYQQWNGWQLGPNGPEIMLVQYQDPARAGQCSPSLTVVRL